MNHRRLVEIGFRWLNSKCTFSFKELKTLSSEIPDIIGFNSSGTFLLEAKVSKQDFLFDAEKEFRKFPEKGMGDWRFYIVPEGLIGVEELPSMWGLLEVNASGKIVKVYNPFGKGNIYSNWLRNAKNHSAERQVMFSALRRLKEKDLLNIINSLGCEEFFPGADEEE